MAEPNNLDDFFAKKDKSKKSKGKKYVSTDVMAKQLDDTGSKNTLSVTSAEKSAKNKEQITVATTTMIPEQVLPVQPTDFETFETVLRQGEDDEWRDIEEKEVDLSGLKIQNLQIGELKDEDLERDRSDSHSDDGDTSRGRDSHGPWKVQQAPAVVKEPEPVKEVEPEAPKAASVYRAPHARNLSVVPAARPRSNKSAPEINSELDFPALSEGPKPPRSGPKKGGLDSDAVKRGPRVERRYEDQQQNTRPRVAIGSKYEALSPRNLS